MSVMAKYEKYIKEEANFCMDDVLYIENVADNDDAYRELLDEVARELILNDELSRSIEKLVHSAVKSILDSKGIEFE